MSAQDDPDVLQPIREKRTQTLIGVWDSLVASNKFDPARLKLSVPLVNEVIEHYLSDYIILKKRYKIEDSRIQLHKVAGLMSAAILRYRPIIPLIDEYASDYEISANEILAVIQGIAICGEYTAKDSHLEILDESWFERWFRDFLYLLHCRNYTAESLIMIYETICCLKFPKNLERVDH